MSLSKPQQRRLREWRGENRVRIFEFIDTLAALPIRELAAMARDYQALTAWAKQRADIKIGDTVKPSKGGYGLPRGTAGRVVDLEFRAVSTFKKNSEGEWWVKIDVSHIKSKDVPDTIVLPARDVYVAIQAELT